jgi:hypothetical protein
MEEGSQTFVLRSRAHNGKRCKGLDEKNQEVQYNVDEEKETEEEETSQEAVGHLDGACKKS